MKRRTILSISLLAVVVIALTAIILRGTRFSVDR